MLDYCISFPNVILIRFLKLFDENCFVLERLFHVVYNMMYKVRILLIHFTQRFCKMVLLSTSISKYFNLQRSRNVNIISIASEMKC